MRWLSSNRSTSGCIASSGSHLLTYQRLVFAALKSCYNPTKLCKNKHICVWRTFYRGAPPLGRWYYLRSFVLVHVIKRNNVLKCQKGSNLMVITGDARSCRPRLLYALVMTSKGFMRSSCCSNKTRHLANAASYSDHALLR